MSSPGRRTCQGLLAPLLAVLVVVLVASCTPVDPSARGALPSASPSPVPTTAAPAGSALAALRQLAVKGRAPKTGFDREAFGRRWPDLDRNGCGTRDDVLHRDLTRITTRPGTHGCVVISGLLRDPYTGGLVVFRKEHASQVQLDHVVSLSNAWQTGAFRLSAQRREQLANDLLELLAVTGRVNAQKSDGDAATWLPPHRPYRCAFVARQIAVKARYGLWVTPAERDAMARVLSRCPAQPLPR